MYQKTPRRVLLMVVAVFAMISMACGLVDRGLDALLESDMLEQVLSVAEMLDESALDLSPYEVSGAEYLFEIDPFDDVIRWRFYTVDIDLLDVGEYYLSQMPVFLVEQDQVINGERYLVLQADHPLSGIYSRDELDALEPGYDQMESTLLDVEVLHSTAHAQMGRLGVSDAMGLLPAPVPADTTLVILVYNHTSTDVGGIIDLVPGVVPDPEQNGIATDSNEMLNEEDNHERGDEGLDEFMEDDETQEITDQSAVCTQVLGSGACYHPYLPVVEGYTRSYRTEDGITTETVTAVRADGFTVVTETADGHTVSADFECTPDGVAGYTFDESIMETLEGMPSDMGFDVDIEGTQLPAEITPGETWSSLVTITISMQAAGAESKNVILIELDYTAVGEETITTPGGRFKAMRIDYLSSGENTLIMTGSGGTFTQTIFTLEGSGSEWYVACLGKVRSVANASWTGIANVDSEVRMELIDFGMQ